MLSNMLKYHNIRQSIEEFLKVKDYDKLNALIQSLAGDEVGLVLQKLSQNDLLQLVNIFPKFLKYEYFIAFSKNLKNALISAMAGENLKKIFSTLTHDDLFLIVSNVSIENKEKILNVVNFNERGAIRLKEKYIHYEIGDIISLDYISMPLYWSVKKAKELILSDKRYYNNNYKILIINEKLEVIGYIAKSALLVAKDNLLLNNIVTISNFIIDILGSSVTTLQNLVADNRWDFMAVLDPQKKLIGVISSTDVLVKSQKVLTSKDGENLKDSFFVNYFCKHFWGFALPLVFSILIFLVLPFLDNKAMFALLHPFNIIIPACISYMLFQNLLSQTKNRQDKKSIIAIFLINSILIVCLIFGILSLLSSLSFKSLGIISLIILASIVLSSCLAFSIFYLAQKGKNLFFIFASRYILTILLFFNFMITILICFFMTQNIL